MIVSSILVLALMAADGSEPWEEAAKDDGVTVYSRSREGAKVQEMKALGLIDAPPLEVWKAIRNYENYKTTMPYMEESRVIATEGEVGPLGPKIIHFYAVIDAPLVSRRDYAIRLVEESDWRDGQGFLRVTWTPSPDLAPTPRDGIVRVTINDGYWHLTPSDGGKRTLATYYVYTDPGGSVPKWIVNRANGSAVPKVFQAIRKFVSKRAR